MTVMVSGLVRVISDVLGHIDNIVLVEIITLVEREAEGGGREEGTEDCRGTHLGGMKQLRCLAILILACLVGEARYQISRLLGR